MREARVRTRCMWVSQISTASWDARLLSPLCSLMLSALMDEDCGADRHIFILGCQHRPSVHLWLGTEAGVDATQSWRCMAHGLRSHEEPVTGWPGPHILSLGHEWALGWRRCQQVVDLTGQGALVGIMTQARLCGTA